MELKARRVERMGYEVEYSSDLIPRNGVLLDNFIYGHTVLKILKDKLYRRPRVAEYPSAAYFSRNALYGSAL
jgi:hypothetical protein